MRNRGKMGGQALVEGRVFREMIDEWVNAKARVRMRVVRERNEW